MWQHWSSALTKEPIHWSTLVSAGFISRPIWFASIKNYMIVSKGMDKATNRLITWILITIHPLSMGGVVVIKYFYMGEYKFSTWWFCQWSRKLFLACRAPVRHFSHLMAGKYQWSFLFSLSEILCVLNPVGQNVRQGMSSLLDISRSLPDMSGIFCDHCLTINKFSITLTTVCYVIEPIGANGMVGPYTSLSVLMSVTRPNF